MVHSTVDSAIESDSSSDRGSSRSQGTTWKYDSSDIELGWRSRYWTLGTTADWRPNDDYNTCDNFSHGENFRWKKLRQQQALAKLAKISAYMVLYISLLYHRIITYTPGRLLMTTRALSWHLLIQTEYTGKSNLHGKGPCQLLWYLDVKRHYVLEWSQTGKVDLSNTASAALEMTSQYTQAKHLWDSSWQRGSYGIHSSLEEAGSHGHNSSRQHDAFGIEQCSIFRQTHR